MGKTKYKIEILDDVNLAWKPIQKTYESLDEAKKNLPTNQKARIMVSNGENYLILNTK